MMAKFEILMKKVEMGGKDYEDNLSKLKNFVDNELEYKDIILKGEIAGIDKNPCPENYER